MIKKIEGGVTAAKGFKAGGIYSGIKKNSSKPDLALIASDVLCNAAAVYTKNKVKAAHIPVTMRHLADGKAQAAIEISGNANTCTGPQGAENALRMAKAAAGALLCSLLP